MDGVHLVEPPLEGWNADCPHLADERPPEMPPIEGALDAWFQCRDCWPVLGISASLVGNSRSRACWRCHSQKYTSVCGQVLTTARS
jgi:hypothetical protein